MPASPAPPPPARATTSAEREELVEELLGFNLRALRSLWELVLRPQRVFRAALEAPGTYTSSLRLWLGLLGLMGLLSFFWGGYEGRALAALEALPQASQQAMMMASGRSLEALAERFGDAMAVLHAPTIGGLTALSTALLRVFHPALRWRARLEIAFGVLTVGSLVGIVIALLSSLGITFGVPGTLAVLSLSYGITYSRGASGLLVATRWRAALLGVVFASVILALVMVGSVLLNKIAMTYATGGA